jgi:hypothetical protein
LILSTDKCCPGPVKKEWNIPINLRCDYPGRD